MPNAPHPLDPLLATGRIARAFHEQYEALAPLFDYKTRDASAVPWEQVPDSNRRLMTATVWQLIVGGYIEVGPAAVLNDQEAS